MTHVCAASTDPFVNPVLRVDTIANLRLVAAPEFRTVYLTEGGATAGDGLGRLYYWDSASNDADNGSTILAPDDGSTGRWKHLPIQDESFIVACSDETTALTTGTAKVTFRMPYAFKLSAVYAELNTAQTSGNIFTVDINEAGTSILSTKLTIDNGEEDSATAATPAVISDANLAARAEMTVDIDQVGASADAKGLKITLVGRQA